MAAGGMAGDTTCAARRTSYRLTAAILFSPLTTALKSEPPRNLGTEDLGTLMAAPVAGFRAVRAAGRPPEHAEPGD